MRLPVRGSGEHPHADSQSSLHGCRMNTGPDKQNLIKFFCAKCGQKFSCDTHAAGDTFPCPQCGTNNTAPATSARSVANPVDRFPVDVIKFFCHHCGQRLACPPALIGTRFDCPNCHTANKVPALHGTQAPQSPLGRTTENALRFFCLSCGQHLSCSPEFAGEKISCPVCSFFTPVPGPVAPADASPADTPPENLEADSVSSPAASQATLDSLADPPATFAPDSQDNAASAREESPLLRRLTQLGFDVTTFSSPESQPTRHQLASDSTWEADNRIQIDE